MNPSIICLHPVQLIHPDGSSARGVVVRVSTDDASIRTRLPARAGDVLVIAGIFDHFMVKAAAVVTGLSANGLSVRFAAMNADSRAHLARFVWARVKPRVPARVLEVKPAAQEPSRRKPYVQWAPQLKETDRHMTVSMRWLEKLPFDPGPIAPRT